MLSGKVIQEHMLRYCNSMKGDKPGRYKYSIDCPDTMWGSAFTALTMALIGEVEKMPQAEKDEWIKHLQSYQVEQTGYFVDHLFKEDDRENLDRGHSQELINAHSSTFVMGMASGYKEKDIKEALSKALMPIVKKQNADGGFYDNLTWGRSEFGWDLCSAKLGESEMNSTLFQSFSISLIGEFLNDEKIMDTVWHHHDTYCHFVRKKAVLK